jgi:hypothetical protein
MFKNGVSVDRVVGFEQLGGKDDFSTAALEARLKAADMVSSSRAAALRREAGESDDEDEQTQHQRSGGLRRGGVSPHSDGDESSDFD